MAAALAAGVAAAAAAAAGEVWTLPASPLPAAARADADADAGGGRVLRFDPDAGPAGRFYFGDDSFRSGGTADDASSDVDVHPAGAVPGAASGSRSSGFGSTSGSVRDADGRDEEAFGSFLAGASFSSDRSFDAAENRARSVRAVLGLPDPRGRVGANESPERAGVSSSAAKRALVAFDDDLASYEARRGEDSGGSGGGNDPGPRRGLRFGFCVFVFPFRDGSYSDGGARVFERAAPRAAPAERSHQLRAGDPVRAFDDCLPGAAPERPPRGGVGRDGGLGRDARGSRRTPAGARVAGRAAAVDGNDRARAGRRETTPRRRPSGSGPGPGPGPDPDQTLARKQPPSPSPPRTAPFAPPPPSSRRRWRDTAEASRRTRRWRRRRRRGGGGGSETAEEEVWIRPTIRPAPLRRSRRRRRRSSRPRARRARLEADSKSKSAPAMTIPSPRPSTWTFWTSSTRWRRCGDREFGAVAARPTGRRRPERRRRRRRRRSPRTVGGRGDRARGVRRRRPIGDASIAGRRTRRAVGRGPPDDAGSGGRIIGRSRRINEASRSGDVKYSNDAYQPTTAGATTTARDEPAVLRFYGPARAGKGKARFVRENSHLS